MEEMSEKTEQELIEGYQQAKDAVLNYISMVVADALQSHHCHSQILAISVLYELAGNVLNSVNKAAVILSDSAIPLDNEEGH